MPESIAAAPVVNDAPVQEAKKEKVAKRSLKKGVSQKEFGGPAKARTPFFLFCDKERPAVMETLRKEAEENGQKLAVTAISKKLGEMWKKVDPETLKTLKEEAEAEKATIANAFEAWKKTEQYKAFLKEVAAHKKKQNDKKANDEIKALGMPKRPMAAYMMFGATQVATVIEELKAKGGNIDMKSRAAAVKAKWDALGEAGQATFFTQAKEAKEKYEKEIAEFKEKPEYQKYQKSLQKNRKAKADGDRLAKYGGDKELAKSKKRKSTASSSKAAKSRKLKNGEKAEGEGEDEVEEEDEDVEVEEEAEDEVEDEEGEDEEGEGEEEEADGEEGQEE